MSNDGHSVRCLLSCSSSIGLTTSWRYLRISSSCTDLLTCEDATVRQCRQCLVQRSFLNEGSHLSEPRHTRRSSQKCCKSRCGVICRKKHNSGTHHDQLEEQASTKSHVPLGHNQMVSKLALVSTSQDRFAPAPQ